MYAVIKTGGKQYKVAVDQVVEIEKLEGDAGTKVSFGEVLLFGNGEGVSKVGVPFLAGAFYDVRDAARARGLERHWVARLSPVVVRAVGFAQATGEALAARGLGEGRPADSASAPPDPAPR